jgi:sugar/nucleoside kinase (ribokinase family)
VKIGIASHIVLDTIQNTSGQVIESVGGPPCYCGITARKFNFDVSLLTKIGRDIPDDMCRVLDNNSLIVSNRQVSENPTTKFRLIADSQSRRLQLISKCEPLSEDEIRDIKVDCWIISPVIDEIPMNVYSAIKGNKGKKNFVMLDPQGYLRAIDNNGNVILRRRLDLDLSGITAVKVDPDEIYALSGGFIGLQGMLQLQSKGVDFVIYTQDRIVNFLHDKTHYWIKLRHIDSADSTGCGDILTSAFSCAYIKEKDPLWAICFAAGALSAALETKQIGLAKIPSMPKIEQNASYFYNTIGFHQLS